MTLQTLKADSPLDIILEAVHRDGACILKDVLDPAQVDQVLSEMGPYIENSETGKDKFGGFNTKRVGALIARSAACRDITMHKTILDLANSFLGPQCDRIQLHLSQIIDIMPGQKAQPLHRDRLAWGLYLPQEVEPQLNTIWALTDFDETNGATHIIPGSQTWPMKQLGHRDDSVQAVMTKGSVLLYTGTVIHGGGENRSAASRVGMNITYCLGWLRTEENMMLSCPPDIARHFSTELTDLLGYTMGNYALGYYSEPAMIPGRSDTQPPENALGRDHSRQPEMTVVDQLKKARD